MVLERLQVLFDLDSSNWKSTISRCIMTTYDTSIQDFPGSINGTDNSSMTTPPRIFTPAELNMAFTAYSFVMTFGATFNFFVCYLILKYRYLRSTINMLILNLAFSDFFAALMVGPYVFIDIEKSNIRGTGANILCGLGEGLSLYFIGSLVSLLTLSVLSISRYLVINHPLKFSWRLQRSHVKYIMCMIWLCALVFILPQFLSWEYDEEKRSCWRKWAPGVHPIAYFTATALVCLIVPLTTLSVTYFCTFYTLWLGKTQAILARIRTESRANQYRQSIAHKKRAVRLLGFLIIVYIVCWLPFGTYWLLSAVLNYFPDDIPGQHRAFRITKVTIFISLCITVINPIVYAFSSRQLRRAAQQALRCRTMNAVSDGIRLDRIHTVKTKEWDQKTTQTKNL